MFVVTYEKGSPRRKGSSGFAAAPSTQHGVTIYKDHLFIVDKRLYQISVQYPLDQIFSEHNRTL